MDNETSELGYIKLSQLENAIAKTKENCQRQGIVDPDISFEFLVGSFYPKVLDHIKEAIKDAYTKGYLAGKEEGDD